MSFQLFPPPPKKQRPINLKRPTPPASPEPAVELLECAKAPVDFHELVIKVNSNPASPVETPPQAHVGSSIAGRSQPRAPVSGTSKSTSQSTSPQTRTRSSSFRSGNGRTTPTSGTSLDNASPGKEPSISEDTISPLSQADRQYTASPSFSDATTLVRNQSTATHRTKLSQTSPKEAAMMRSIFPRYNPNLPLSQQQYKPTQASPTDIPTDKISRKPYSPTFYVPHADVLRSGSAEEPYYTPKIDLGALWDAANGKARPEGWRTYALQMHCRKANSPGDADSFAFGSSPVQPFYSLEQALIDKDTNACEVLIYRNNPMQPKNNTDTLPIAHLAVQTPPPHGPPPPPEVFYERPDLIPQATPITTITPKLAILGALEEAAQGPRGSEIASFDPKAESPAAAALAADAVVACEALNGCQLLHCPVSEPLMPPYEADKTGTYELRHPTLGAFPVVVQGDVKRSLEAALETASKTKGNGKSNKGGTKSGQENSNTTSAVAVRSTSPVSHIPTTITMLNPFAAPRSSTITTDQKQQRHNSYYYNNNYNNTDRPASPAPDEVLARLSLHTATLTIDAAAIAALGADKTSPHAHSPHPHMIDVAASAIMAVLVAERRREHPPHVATPGGGSPGQQQVLYGGGTWPSNNNASGTSMPMVFEGPPTAAARRWPGMEPVGPRELVREKVRLTSWGWWFGTTEEKEAKKAAKRDKKRRKEVVDIEMGQGPNGRGAVEAEGKGKGKGDEEGLHWLVELVLVLLLFAFKVVWFVLGLLFKVLGKAVGVVNRCAAKP